ncbi:DUF2141 domain-containing protein [Porphyrobacter sp. GA68]|uniref:DUF2141 domain-containing protein n=1 Tax=Porphyrobacter sp. GA68 TaxID=2883480 RepID=UPI001D1982B7|nr:DUF2141 domain-containing protein [Porphyrobacter sp. GA68]
MRTTFKILTGIGLAASALALPATPVAAQYNQVVRNDLSRCAAGQGAGVMLTINNISQGTGTVRVQSYRGTSEEWLASGKWLTRTELPARAGTMRVCVPLPGPGTYAIAVRHDVNGNGRTDLRQDGGAMSNNPSINVLNMGRPSYTRTRFQVGNAPIPMTVQMRYFR